MGGRKDGGRDFQIFNRGPRLAGFIRYLTGVRADDVVALVLNGDIIDALAEEEVRGYVALDAGTALRMMEHIYTDPAFAPVWCALAEFIRQPRRHLVFVVGNHDIELSLPIVEDSIRRRLAEGVSEAQTRLTFATHGSGFACRVGPARVFCTHGNEVDEWNWVDYSLLGQLANAMEAGRAVDGAKWTPNAGTRLVVDVMNTVKAQYPFVDLLKPEVAAVVSVLLAIDKDTLKKVNLEAAFPVLREKIRGRLITSRLLAAEATTLAAAPPSAVADEALAELLGPSFREAVQVQRQTSGGLSEDALLLDAGRAVAMRRSPAESMTSNGGPETLGAWDLVAGWIGLVPRIEGLRRALQDWLKDDKTFDVTAPTADGGLYDAMQERVGDGIDFVITGHTHLARALPFRSHGYYYNCGTWIRTLRLTQEALEATAFEADVWPALSARRMSALDNAMIPGPNGSRVPLLLDRTHAVRIATRNGHAIGDLLRVTDAAVPGGAEPDAEEHTQAFTVG
jgi:UDP-2,3-diacylglucosamine pyrophosphatase LpxH